MMAPRSRSATTLDQRPTSSSGVADSSRNAVRNINDSDKRKSRDDLYLMLNADKQRFHSFHVPHRGRQNSKGPTDKSRMKVSRESTRTTPTSPGTQGHPAAIPIGMALGSPSHLPQAGAWRPQLSTIASPAAAESQRTEDDTTPKSKPRMWGLFRSKSRSKRARANTETNPPQPAASDFQVRPTGHFHPPEQQQQPGLGRSDSVATGSAKHKPIVVRSYTEPIGKPASGTQPRHSPQPNRAAPRPPYKSTNSTQSQYHERPTPAAAFHLPASKGPFLDIEIPDTKLERYSVMFGQVLQRKSSQPNPSVNPPFEPPQARPAPQKPLELSKDISASSLLIRRQGTLKKLKTIEDEPTEEASQTELVRPRRLTSPQHKSSPSFNLFPPTPRRTNTPQVLTPRSRSNTLPVDLPSPGHQPSVQAPAMREPLRSQTFPRTVHQNNPGDRATHMASHVQERPLPAPPAPWIQHSTPPLASKQVFDSPTSIDEPEPELLMKATYQPSISDPSWEMISPPPSTASSHASTPKNGSLSSITSSEHISVIKVEGAGEEADAEQALIEAVEASITRQISVSREQRQLLGSLRSKPRRRDTQALGFGPMTAGGNNERLVESKRLTPTIVHPEQQRGVKSVHKYRKSECVILEG